MLLISVDSHQSSWVHFEMSEILKRASADADTFILPVLIEVAELPGYLRDAGSLRDPP